MLIPNLNKIMEEFAEAVEEKNFELVTMVNEGEIRERIVGAEIEVEEGRKKKRDEEEDKEQSSREEIEDFLSDKAYEMIVKKILKENFFEKGGSRNSSQLSKRSLRRDDGI